MYPFNKKRGVGLKGSMNYGEVARKYTGLLMENRDFFCLFLFYLPLCIGFILKKMPKCRHESRCHLQIGSRI